VHHSIIKLPVGPCIIFYHAMTWTLHSCHEASVTRRDGGKKHFYSVVELLVPSFPSDHMVDGEDGGASCHGGIVPLRCGPAPIEAGRGGDPDVCIPSAPFEAPRDVSRSVFTDLSSCWSSAYEAAWAALTLSIICILSVKG
jgi:hypothetical protein